MKQNLLKSISKENQNELFDALYYMKMAELKAFCNKLCIPSVGKKGPIIERIKHYLLTGAVLEPLQLPEISKAKPGKKYLLSSATLILRDSYKNDAKTRKFFQTLAGKHFHFTAFGQDWILHRWQQGKPPTYAEFAKFWQKEFNRRKNFKANPKQEWAYLNFTQRYLKNHPRASRMELVKAWEKERKKYVAKAKKILDTIS